MDVNEAYDHTRDIIEKIKRAGVEVKIEPCKSRNDKGLVESYNRPDRISPDKWVHVSFLLKNEKETNMIFEEGKALRELNICFDTGGYPGCRDWELDWSFTVREDANSERKRFESVESFIGEIEGSKVGEK